MDEFAQFLSNLSSGTPPTSSSTNTPTHSSSAPDLASFFGGGASGTPSAMSQPQLFPSGVSPGPSSGFPNDLGGVFTGISPAQAHHMQMVAQQKLAAANKATHSPLSGSANISGAAGNEAMARLMAMVQNGNVGGQGGMNPNWISAFGGGNFPPGLPQQNFGMGMNMGTQFGSGSSGMDLSHLPTPATPSNEWPDWNRPTMFNDTNTLFGGAFGLPNSNPSNLFGSLPSGGVNSSTPRPPSSSSARNANASNVGASSSGSYSNPPPMNQLSPDQIKALESLGIPSSELQAAAAPQSSTPSRPGSTKPTDNNTRNQKPPTPQNSSNSSSDLMSMITGSLTGTPPSISSSGFPAPGFPSPGGQPNLNYLLSLARSGQLPPGGQAIIQNLLQSGRFPPSSGPSSSSGPSASNPMNGVEMALGSLLGKGNHHNSPTMRDSGSGGAQSFLQESSNNGSPSANDRSRSGPPQLTIKVDALKEHVSHLNQLRLYQAQIEHMERCLREGLMIPFSAPGLPAPSNLTTQPLDMQSRAAIEMKLGEFRHVVPQLQQMIQRFHLLNGGEENVNAELGRITAWQNQQQHGQSGSSPPKTSSETPESRPPGSFDPSQHLSRLSQFHQVYNGRANGSSQPLTTSAAASTSTAGASTPSLFGGEATVPGVSSMPHPPNPVPSFDSANSPTPQLSSTTSGLQIGQIIPLKLLQTQLRPDTFMKALFDMMRHRGTPITGTPYIEGKEVDLYHLYQAVMTAGGSADIDKADSWVDIATRIGLLFNTTDPGSKSQTAAQLKGLYRSLLAPFEEVWTKALIKQQQQLKDYHAATGQLNMFGARQSMTTPPAASSTSTATPAMSSAAHAALGLTPPNPTPAPATTQPTPPPTNPPNHSPSTPFANPRDSNALGLNPVQIGGLTGPSSLLLGPSSSQPQMANDLSAAMLARASSDEKKIIEDAKQTIEELKSKLQAHRRTLPKLKIIEHMGEVEKDHIRRTVPQLAPMIDRVLGILHLYLAMSNQVEAARRLLLMVCMFRDQMEHLGSNEFMLSSSDIDKLKTQMERCWIFVHSSPAAQTVRSAEAQGLPIIPPGGIGLLSGGSVPPGLPQPLMPPNPQSSQTSLKRPNTSTSEPAAGSTSGAPGTANHPIDLADSPSAQSSQLEGPRVKRRKTGKNNSPVPSPTTGGTKPSTKPAAANKKSPEKEATKDGDGKPEGTTGTGRGRGRGRGRGGGRGRGRGRGGAVAEKGSYKAIMDQVKNDSSKPGSGSPPSESPPEDPSDKGKGKGKSPASSVPTIEVGIDGSSPFSTPASKPTPGTTVASKSPEERNTSDADANTKDPASYLENMLKGLAGGGNVPGNDGSAAPSDLSEFLAHLEANGSNNFKKNPESIPNQSERKASQDFLPDVGGASSIATTSASTLTPSFPAAAAALGISSLGQSTSSSSLDFDFLDPTAFSPAENSFNAANSMLPSPNEGDKIGQQSSPTTAADSSRQGEPMETEDEMQRYQKMFGGGDMNNKNNSSSLGGNGGDEFAHFLAGLGNGGGTLFGGGGSGDAWDLSNFFKQDATKTDASGSGAENNPTPWSFS